MNLSTLKFIIKNLKYFYNKQNHIKLNKHVDIYKNLKINGVVKIKNYFTEVECKKIKIKLINTLKKDTNTLTTKSNDKRYWGFEKLCPYSKKFLKDKNLLELIKKYECQDRLIASTVLAANIKFKKNGKGSGEGWHRDRTFYKYKYCKAMIYLEDVDKNNGPFQYMEKSNKLINIIKLNEILKKKYSDKWFTNKEIKNASKKLCLKILTLTASAGDLIIFDATGIHRGKPLISGERFAITNYYRFDPNEKLPFGVNDQKNN